MPQAQRTRSRASSTKPRPRVLGLAPARVKVDQAAQHKVQSVQSNSERVTVSTSLEMTRELLGATLTSVAFLRNLFPEEDFARRSILQVARDGEGAQGPRVSAVKVMALKAGAQAESDKFQAYIDEGISDALSRGYLDRVELRIYSDPDAERDLLELWRLRVTYETDSSGLKQPTIEVSDKSDRVLGRHSTLGEVKADAQVIIRSLLATAESLPDLPRTRLVNFGMFYTPETPARYSAPGFEQVDDEQETVLNTRSKDERPFAKNFGTVLAGHHALSIDVMSVAELVQTDEDPNATESQALERARQEAASRKVEWPATAPAPADGDEAVDEPQEEGVESGDRSGPAPVLNLRGGGKDEARCECGALDSGDIVTCTRCDQCECCWCCGHLFTALEHQIKDDEEFVCVSCQAAQAEEDAGRKSDNFNPRSPPPGSARAKTPTAVSSTRSEISNPLVPRPNAPLRLRGGADCGETLAGEGDLIECECGAEDDGDVTLCKSCDRWKCCWCYGRMWTSQEHALSDEDEFTCFSCEASIASDHAGEDERKRDLIRAAEEGFKLLALKRRLIAETFDNGVQDSNFYAQKFCSTKETMQSILDALQSEGFLHEVDVKSKLKGKGKGKAVEKKRAFEYDKKAAVELKRQRIYFNPGRGAESELREILKGSGEREENKAEVNVQAQVKVAPIERLKSPAPEIVPPVTVAVEKAQPKVDSLQVDPEPSELWEDMATQHQLALHHSQSQSQPTKPRSPHVAPVLPAKTPLASTSAVKLPRAPNAKPKQQRLFEDAEEEEIEEDSPPSSASEKAHAKREDAPQPPAQVDAKGPFIPKFGASKRAAKGLTFRGMLNKPAPPPEPPKAKKAFRGLIPKTFELPPLPAPLPPPLPTATLLKQENILVPATQDGPSSTAFQSSIEDDPLERVMSSIAPIDEDEVEDPDIDAKGEEDIGEGGWTKSSCEKWDDEIQCSGGESEYGPWGTQEEGRGGRGREAWGARAIFSQASGW